MPSCLEALCRMRLPITTRGIYMSRINNLFLSFDMKVVLLCEGSKEDFIHGLKPLRKRVRYFA